MVVVLVLLCYQRTSLFSEDICRASVFGDGNKRFHFVAVKTIENGILDCHDAQSRQRIFFLEHIALFPFCTMASPSNTHSHLPPLSLKNNQDTVTGFLLAGVGHRTADGSNFLIVKQDTKLQQVEEAFESFSTRDDVGIILINQHIASDIRHVLKSYTATIPTVLEIPSKEHPYDPEQDTIMQRVNMFLGGGGI